MSDICVGFIWIGQSLRYCDRCSRPYWEHSHDSWRGKLTRITEEEKVSAMTRWGDDM